MMEIQFAEVLDPPGFRIDVDLLQDFERGLDTSWPEKNPIPCTVLGYGEISTVLNIHRPEFEGLAFKRISVFRTNDELAGYLETYLAYNDLLGREVGLSLPDHGYCVAASRSGRPILYLIQIQLPSGAICNQRMENLRDEEIEKLFEQILSELDKVWAYNIHDPNRQVAIDGQLSNWCLDPDCNPDEQPTEEPGLMYIDTSTPQIRIHGVEQLNGELFLRSAPPILEWLLRTLYMDEVMDRYYHPHLVIMDLIANFYKEGRPELIPSLVELANDNIASRGGEAGSQMLDEEEIRDYYNRDKSIWQLYLRSRRLDRFIRGQLLGREYPYILPGPVAR